MQIQATAKSIRISPRKVRLIADMVRNKSVDQVLMELEVLQKRGASAIAKTLKSAIANAVNNAKLERGNLKIASIDVMEGMRLKRYHPSTRGRIHPYMKRSSHVRVVLEEKGATK